MVGIAKFSKPAVDRSWFLGFFLCLMLFLGLSARIGVRREQLQKGQHPTTAVPYLRKKNNIYRDNIFREMFLSHVVGEGRAGYIRLLFLAIFLCGKERRSQSTYHIYKEYHIVYVPSSELGLSHPPLSPASVPFPPGIKGGGGHTRLRARGLGSPNSDD